MPLLPLLLVCTIVCFQLGTASSSASDVVRALSEASALVERGMLTRKEFDELKAELLLERVDAPAPPALPRFFGDALASHTLPARTELTIFNREVGGTQGAVLTLFQYLGLATGPGEARGFNDTRIRYYIDGEHTASIDYSLYMGVGLGFNGSSLVNRSWGTARVGSLAAYSTYSTIRVPFSRSIRITAEMPAYIESSQLIWVDVRGAEGLRIAIGDSISLAPTDYRLRLYKNEAVHVPAGYMIPLAKTNRSGLLYMTAIQVESQGYGYLEGCWRAKLGDDDWTLLTSGGEEMFMGAYYFDNHDTSILPFVGLTRKEITLIHGQMKATLSAFVEYTEYPVTFESGLDFQWQNGAEFDMHRGSPTYFQKCGPMPSSTHTSPGNFTSLGGDPDMTITSYVWLYESIGSEPFPDAGGAPPPPSPPYPKWPEFGPCPQAVCDGTTSHGRNWGGPPSNGTANGTGVVTLDASACVRLCEKDPFCKAMTWKAGNCHDTGVGPCGGPDMSCCYLLASDGKKDSSPGWCTWTKTGYE